MALVKMGNHKDFRTLSKDKSWQGVLSDAARLLLSMLTALVYSSDKDGTLKTTLKSCVDVAEFVTQCGMIAELAAEVRTTAARAAGRPDAAKEGCAMDLDADASGEAVSLEFLLEKDQREILKDLSEDTAT